MGLDDILKLLIQLPIVGVVVWVVLQLLKHAKDERAVFMTAMQNQAKSFTEELKSERDSREKTTTRMMDSLLSLSTAITELRGEVRFGHLAGREREKGAGR